MMNEYLILKIQGPMQSWGGHTYEDYRPSENLPTRSGVIGLLAACLGIDRSNKQQLLNLANTISMAVRQDKRTIAISRLTDFHTVENARKVDGSVNKNPVVSRREYLCDASFTLALQVSCDGDYSLDVIADAIRRPIYTPFLGRRSCPITRPLYEDKVYAESFVQALRKISPVSGLIYCDADESSDGQIQLRDVPLNRHRQFGTRRVYIHAGHGEPHVSE